MRKQLYSFVVEPEMIVELKDAALGAGVSASEFLRLALRTALDSRCAELKKAQAQKALL